MADEAKTKQFKVVAVSPVTGGSGASTVLETEKADELVVVGKLDAAVLEHAAVKKHLGDDEIAVVIPKALLLKAAKEFL
jgi:hypothetical protein